MGDRHLRPVVAAIALAFALASEALQLRAGADPQRALIDVAVGMAYVLGGLYASARDPGNRVWWLMTAAGFGWFVGNYAASDVGPIHAFGTVFADTDAILLIALVLSYPNAMPEGRANRAVVLIAAVGLTGANLLALLTGDATLSLVLGLALTAAVAVLVPLRWLRAAQPQRQRLGPAVLATSVTLLAIGVAIAVRLLPVSETVRTLLLAARDLGVLAIPLGFVVGSFQVVEHELRSSQIRIVDAMDTERRRLERDLHDGAQQRLVSLSLALRLARTQLASHDEGKAIETIDGASEELKAAIAELRELARGIHPAVLTESGLTGALAAIADRSPVPVDVTNVPEIRLPAVVEITAYFIVAEALTNVGRYANASQARLTATIRDGHLRLEIEDDGVGGADASRGTGLAGLRDRVAALGGRLTIHSPPGRGTSVVAIIPVAAAAPSSQVSGLPLW